MRCIWTRKFNYFYTLINEKYNITLHFGLGQDLVSDWKLQLYCGIWKAVTTFMSFIIETYLFSVVNGKLIASNWYSRGLSMQQVGAGAPGPSLFFNSHYFVTLYTPFISRTLWSYPSRFCSSWSLPLSVLDPVNLAGSSAHISMPDFSLSFFQ